MNQRITKYFRHLLDNGLNFVKKFGKPIGHPVRAIDPCPFGCKDLLGNPRMFLGCHLPASALFHEGEAPRRGGRDRAIKRSGEPKGSRSYFSVKGKTAEEYVHALTSETFFSDWCYQNPMRLNGKELCDLLIVFGTNAIIIQIKDVEPDRRTGRFKTSDVEKNHRQLLGALGYLLQLKTPLRLKNAHRGEEAFQADAIQEFHLVSVLLGTPRKSTPLTCSEHSEKIHEFTGDFFATLLNELDTAKDLFGYLDARERLFESDIYVRCEADEKSLLACYIAAGYHFDFLHAGLHEFSKMIWQKFIKTKAYLEKKEADKQSYLWDEIIANLHTGRIVGEDGASYKRLARVMATVSRNERRGLVTSFLRGFAIATTLPPGHDTHSSLINDRNNHVTYCFFYYADSEIGKSNLADMFAFTCLSARVKFPNKVVIGIACCPMDTQSLGWRFSMDEFDQAEPTPEETKVLEEHARRVGIVDGGVKTYAERILPAFLKEK